MDSPVTRPGPGAPLLLGQDLVLVAGSEVLVLPQVVSPLRAGAICPQSPWAPGRLWPGPVSSPCPACEAGLAWVRRCGSQRRAGSLECSDNKGALPTGAPVSCGGSWRGGLAGPGRVTSRDGEVGYEGKAAHTARDMAAAHSNTTEGTAHLSVARAGATEEKRVFGD